MSYTQTSISSVNAAYAGAIAVRSGQAADLGIPDATDVVLTKWLGHAVLFGTTAYYIAKMNDEIAGISRRADKELNIHCKQQDLEFTLVILVGLEQ
jgi:hypothetical protein